MNRKFSPRGVNMKHDQLKENNDNNVKNNDDESTLKLSPAVNNALANQSLYIELSMDDLFEESHLLTSPVNENNTKFNEKGSSTPSQDDAIILTQVQNLSTSERKKSLSSIPGFKKKLNKMDESSVRKIYYLLFQQKSRFKEYDEVINMITNFSAFDYDTGTMKAKVLTDANVWGKSRLIELCKLLSLEENGSRAELVNGIFSFLNKFESSEKGKVKVVEMITESKRQTESKKKTSNQLTLLPNKKLGDDESIQARLNLLPINKMLKSLCFIMTNIKHHQSASIKETISNFRGFQSDDIDGLKQRMLLNAGQWSLISLQEACSLLGISEDGSRAMLITRMIDFLCAYFSNQTTKICTSSSSSDAISKNVNKKRKVENISDDEEEDDEEEVKDVVMNKRKNPKKLKFPSSSSIKEMSQVSDLSTAAGNAMIVTNENDDNIDNNSDDDQCDYDDNLGYMSTGTLVEE